MQPSKIGNPEAVTEKEAKFFDEMKVKISDLLDDLKTNGHIEKPTKSQIDAFIKIMTVNDRHATIYNILTEIIIYPETTQNFLNYPKTYGITESNFPELYVFTMIANLNRQTEGFKLAFLIMLKKSFWAGNKDKMTLGKLCVELNKKSTKFANEVTKELEVGLRNVFSHQTN